MICKISFLMSVVYEFIIGLNEYTDNMMISLPTIKCRFADDVQIAPGGV